MLIEHGDGAAVILRNQSPSTQDPRNLLTAPAAMYLPLAAAGCPWLPLAADVDATAFFA